MRIPPLSLLLSALVFFAACDDDDDDAVDGRIDASAADASTDALAMDAAADLGGDAAPTPDAQPDIAADAQPDAGPDAVTGVECDPAPFVAGDPMPGDCTANQRISGTVDGVKVIIRPDCTDPAITALADKQHLLMVPDTITQDALWVHFGGSGGKPTGSENIGLAAASVGYRYISLAYPNEPSIAARCACPEGPRPASCEGAVRTEVLTGREMTPWFDMEADEAIVPRLVALLLYLDGERPQDGWANYLTDEGQPDWTRFAVSGFSQGGGMAGLIARDHAVARALYFSKGAGASLDEAAAEPCNAHADCASGVCCPLDDLECEVPTPDALCLGTIPSPWAAAGRDTDDDGLGDGPVESRATPPGRQFAVLHRDEGAFGYSPEVFSSWGMGGRDTIVDADTGTPPYGNSQIMSTGLPPRGQCSEHQSMGADACQPRRADGLPAMWDAWVYAMSTPVE